MTDTTDQELREGASMTDPIEAVARAIREVIDGLGTYEQAARAALSAYRDAEIENLRAQLAAARQLACNNAEGAANAIRECAELRSQLADCRAVLRKIGHADWCSSRKCATCGCEPAFQEHWNANIDPVHHVFRPFKCTCGYARVMGEG